VLLPAFIALFGIIAALFLVGFTPWADPRDRRRGRSAPDAGDVVDDDYDDDEYVEFVLVRKPPATAPTRATAPAPRATAAPSPRAVSPPPRAVVAPPPEEESDTGPIAGRVEHPLPAPADTWHSDPVESWHSLLDDPEPPDEPIGFAHNGSHADTHQRFRPVTEFSGRAGGSRDERHAPPERQLNGFTRPHPTEGERRRGHRYRPDPDDDPTGHGRHSSGN
jgi:hypothetical protein